MDNNYYVYLHLFPNKKRYYGITCQEPNQRWENGNGYKEQDVYYAILEFGWDNIEHKIIAKGLTEEQASIMERYLILKWKSNNEKYGYNCSYGGEITNGESISKRKKQLAEQGKFIGGTCLFGYTKANGKLIVDKDKAPIVKEMFNIYYNQGSEKTMEYLQANGYNISTRSVLLQLLTNTTYKGYYYKNEQIYIQELDIIGAKLFDKIQMEIKNRSTKNEIIITNKTQYLGESLVFCFKCNKKFYINSCKNNSSNSYRANCTCLSQKNFSIKKFDKIIDNMMIEKFGEDYKLLDQLEKKLFIRNVVEKIILNSWEDIQIIYK